MARPREFEPEEALDKAMRQFWAKGYHDTSIRDLVDATGVNYYGLYGVFENKHGLFLAALDRYRDTVTAEILAQLKRPGPLVNVITKTYEHLLNIGRTRGGPIGCLMCNTAVELASEDPAAASKVHANMAQLRKGFRAKLTEAQQSGELAVEHDVGALAEFLTTTVYSLALLLRSGCDKAYVRRHIRTTVSLLN